MRKLYVIFVLAGLLLLPTRSYAQVVKSTELTAAVRAKALTLLAPASVTMSAIDVSPDPVDSTGTMTGVEAQDLRGKKTPLGWSLTMTAMDFKTADNDIIPVTQLTVTTNSYKFLNGKDGGISVSGAVTATDANNDGTSDAISILNAAAGSGAGSFQVDPTLKLNVPAYSVAGDYQSTVMLTLL